MDGNFHVTDDNLESYAMGRLRESDLGNLEEHLLICEACQVRLDETETYIRALRVALRKARERPETVWEKLWGRGVSTPAWAGAFAVVVIALGVTTQVPRFHRGAPSNEIVTVRLEAMKGEAGNSVADRPLELMLDARGLPPASGYHLQIVNHEGKAVWQSTAAAGAEETLRAFVAKRLGSGTYFVRVFGDGPEPLREFGLQIR